ncbi:Bromodomain family protein [Candida albicans]|uniref:Bromodomain family protein n=1 Tax=Candida albicans TaxID=5476 RepID=A0A8H6BVV6_CANAX|nr:Bromodomain family protein [Candida albicans]
MPPKRKLSQSSAESSPVKKSTEESQNVAVTHSPQEYLDFFTSTLDMVFNLRDGDEELAPPFIKLPSKKFYPDYYHLIKQPISLNEIGKRIKTRYSGTSSREFLDDFELLLENASTYNSPDSWIVESARKIVNFVEGQVEEFESTSSTNLSTNKAADDTKKPRIKLKLKSIKKQTETETGPEFGSLVKVRKEEPLITFGRLAEFCINILNDVINHKFPNQGVLSGPFLEEVDTEVYTDYLDYVTKPMSFNTILSNLEKKKLLSPKFPLLDNLKKFHDTTTLIFSNAKAYNNEDSQIYQDAVILEEYFNEQYNKLKSRIESEADKLHPSTPKLNLTLPTNADTQDIDEPADSKELDTSKSREVVTERNAPNTMGKTLPLLPEQNSIIQESVIFSSPAVSTNITKFVQQKSSQPATILSRDQEIKKSLFPTQPGNPIATLFSYKVPANGYTDQAHTIALPNGASPFVSFKVSLHNLLYQLKEPELIDDHGILSHLGNDDFQCKLSVNEEEVSNVADCFKEEKGEDVVLGVQYDVKLSYGLNVLSFNCKVAPALSKKIKNTFIEEEEVARRHTRHQLQQMQKTWDVETITFYVVCISG